MTFSTFFWLALALWGLGAAIAFLHRLGLRVSRQLLRVLLGALIVLHLLGPGELLSIPLGGGPQLPLAPAVLIPVVYFAILAAYVAESVAAAAFLVLSLLGVFVLMGLGLPALDRLAVLSGALGGGGELPLAHLLGEARQVAGNALGFALGAYLMLVLFQALLNRWQARRAWLAAGLALLAGGALGRALAVFLGTAGSPDWLWRLGGEVLGWGFSGLLLWPLQALYLGLLARREGVIPGSGRSTLEVFATTRSLQGALEAAAARAERLGEHLRLVSEVGRTVLRAESPQGLLRSVGERLLASPHAARVWLGLVDGDGSLRSVAAFLGRSGRVDLAGLEVEAPALALQALEKGEPVQGEAGEVALPLEAGARVMGVLWVASSAGRTPGEGWLAALTRVAADLAHGLNRLQAEQALRRHLERLETVRDLVEAVTAEAGDVDQLLRSSLERAVQFLGGAGGCAYLREGEALRCVAAVGSEAGREGSRLALGEGLAGEVARAGRPAVRADPPRAAAPLTWEEATLGVLEIVRQEGQTFHAEEVAFLSLFAAQMGTVLQNARLIRESREQAERFRRLHEASRRLLEAESAQGLTAALAEILLDLASADAACVCLVEEAGSGLQPVAMMGDGAEALHALCVGEGEAGGGLIDPIPSTAVSLPLETSETEWESLLAVPLLADGAPLGVAVLGFREGRGPVKEAVALAEQAVAQAALALARLRALESEHRRRAELEALRQASLSLTSRLDLQSVLERILEHALRLVGADDAHIFIYDGQRLRFGAALWAGGVQKEPFAKPRLHGLTYSVARAGQRIVVHDARNHPLYEDSPWDGAIVGLPLKVEGRVVGVMNVAFTRPHVFDDDELRALELLADQAAIALQNARLFERTLADRRRVLLLYEVTRALATSLDPDLILERAVGLTAETLGGLHGLAFLQEQGTDRLRVRVAYGFDNLSLREVDERLSLRIGEGLVGWVVAQREPVLVEDVREDPRWVPVPEVDAQVRSLIATPVSAGEGLRGALVVSRAEPGAFDEEHLDLLVSIGRQVALALSNAERYRQVERRLTELTAIQQVAQVINRRLDMGSLLEAIVEQVHAVLGYPVVDIALVEGDELVQWAGRGAPRGRGRRYPLDQGVVGRAVRTGEPQFVPDVRQDPDYVALEAETESEIAVPLKKGDVVIGVLNVESRQKGELTEDDLRLLTLLGDQIAIALENAALYERLRQQASELEEVVARRTAELAEALEQAREADRLKSEFVSDVSHELRTPLSNIRLYAELLAQGKPERFEEYLRTLERETERLSILIEDLLTISRLDAGSARPILEPVDVNLLLRTLVQDRRRLFAQKGLELTFEAADDLPEVVGDPAMLSQVIANLMTNALHYTPSGGQVRLSTEAVERRGRRWVKVEVSDTGVGIPEEEQGRLFERFFRGSAARASGAPGTGLGLAICKEILDRHGGGITVRSQPGEGSTFTVWLPARQWLVQREASASEGLA